MNFTSMTFSNDTKKSDESTVVSPTGPQVIDLLSYYDSEPSSRPPQYSQTLGKSTTRPPTAGSGAAVATIAAILAYPSEAQYTDRKEKDSRP